jgi:hypothetical protein
MATHLRLHEGQYEIRQLPDGSAELILGPDIEAEFAAQVVNDPEIRGAIWRAFVTTIRDNTELRKQFERGEIDWDRLAFEDLWRADEPPSDL